MSFNPKHYISKKGGGKFLIVQVKMVGDVLTSSMLCEAIKREYPSAEIHYLVHQSCRPVVENHPDIDRLIELSPEAEKNPAPLLKFLREIKKEQYDVVIDAYSKPISVLYAQYSKAKIKIGLRKRYTDIFYQYCFDNKKESEKSLPLAFENRLQMTQPVVGEVDYSLKPKIYISEGERKNMLKLLKRERMDIEGKQYIMVNVLGSSKSKTYPLPFMAKLLDAIAENFPELKLLLNYIPGQKKEVQKLLENCREQTRKQINSFYAPSLREFIVLTSFCRAVIGNEGGGIHIGKALNLPTFAIFSPWIDKKVWGYSEQSEKHQSVHLQDFKIEIFKGVPSKKRKEKSTELYAHFSPDFISGKLIDFFKNIYRFGV